LEKFSLDALQRTKVGAEFEEALKTVQESFVKDRDVAGARAITLTIEFNTNAAGEKYRTAEMKVSVKTPRRSMKSIAVLDEHGQLKIDTTSNDARQPELFDQGQGSGELKLVDGGV
jgi:hypothetical protein